MSSPRLPLYAWSHPSWDRSGYTVSRAASGSTPRARLDVLHRLRAAERVDDVVEAAVEGPQRHAAEGAPDGGPRVPAVGRDRHGRCDLAVAVRGEVLPRAEAA